jgi:hypothetical protein
MCQQVGARRVGHCIVFDQVPFTIVQGVEWDVMCGTIWGDDQVFDALNSRPRRSKQLVVQLLQNTARVSG